ncbi:MAG: hypothetical protein KDB88_14510 [Flavobacteriales bacterium]|nr:hypothetical protein [Flavobacteriales bacterium]
MIITPSLKFFPAVTLACFLPLAGAGQCIMGNANAPQSNASNVRMGQSFTPTCNGLIEYVEIFTTNGGTNTVGTLHIYNGSTVTSAPIHTQAVPAITVNPGEAVRVFLSAPVTATAFQQRTFEMDMSLTLPFSGGNPYSGGRLFYNGTNSSVYNNSDLKFNVSVISNCTNTTASIAAAACQQYESPSGLLWDSTGVYTDTIPNVAGCDSIITVDLSVIALDTSVTLDGATLLSNEDDADGYQWLDCMNGNAPIPGADQASFTPTASGTYAVQLTVDTCVAVSDCVFVGSTGVEEGAQGTLALWPNPSNGLLQFSDMPAGAWVTATDAMGRPVALKRAGYQFEILDPVPGVYLLRIQDRNGLDLKRRLLVE